MKNRSKSFRLSILTIAAVAILGFSVIIGSSISANGSQSGSGSGGGNITSGAATWRAYYGKAGTAEAWNKFYAGSSNQAQTAAVEAAWTSQHIDSQGITTGGKKLSQVCKESEEIWYSARPLSSHASGRAFATQIRNSHKNAWHSEVGDLPNGKGSASSVQKFRDYRYSTIGSYWLGGKVNIICTAPFDRPAPKAAGNVNWTSSKGNINHERKVEFTTQQSVKATLKNRGNEWVGENQNAVTKETPIQTVFLSKNNPSGFTTVTQWDNWVVNAKKHSQKIENKVTFTNTNVNRLLEGGVADIVESDRVTTYTANFQDVITTTRTYTKYVDSKGNHVTKDGKAVVMPTVVNGRVTNWGNLAWHNNEKVQSVSGAVSIPGPKHSLQPARKWQLITVKCNADEFRELMSTVGGSVYIDNGAQAFNVGYTPVVGINTTSRLGNPADSNALVRTTATNTFFTKTLSCERAVQCTPERNAAFPESTYNGFSNDTFDKRSPLGAQAILDNWHIQYNIPTGFEFFRDNAGHPIRLNINYPKIIGGASGEFFPFASSAKLTMISRHYQGTPGEDLFSISDGKGNHSHFKNNVLTLPGQVNRPNVHGAWASEEGKPQKLNVSWAYDVLMTAKVPTVVNGEKILDSAIKSSNLDVVCSFSGGSNANKPFESMTTAPVGPNRKVQDFSHSRGYIEILFNRSVAEE